MARPKRAADPDIGERGTLDVDPEVLRAGVRVAAQDAGIVAQVGVDLGEGDAVGLVDLPGAEGAFLDFQGCRWGRTGGR